MRLMILSRSCARGGALRGCLRMAEVARMTCQVQHGHAAERQVAPEDTVF